MSSPGALDTEYERAKTSRVKIESIADEFFHSDSYALRSERELILSSRSAQNESSQQFTRNGPAERMEDEVLMNSEEKLYNKDFESAKKSHRKA